MSEQIQLLPFTRGTMKRKINVPRSRAPEMLRSGQSSTILPRNGYGAHIRLHCHVRIKKTGLVFKDQYTDTYTDDGDTLAGDVPTLENIYALLPNVQLVNNRNHTPVDLSAYDLALLADHKRPGYDIVNRNVERIEENGYTIFHFVVDVPLVPNLGRACMWGLIGLQSNQAEWTLKFTWADITQVFEGLDDSVQREAFIDPVLTYFDIPDPNVYMQPPLNIGYMLRGRTISGGRINSGDFEEELSPLGGTLTRALIQFVDKQGRPFEASRGDFLTVPTGKPYVKNMKVVIDSTDVITDYSALEHEHEHEDVYGKRTHPGVFTYVDGFTVLDTQVGDFLPPDFSHMFLNPDKFASAKLVTGIELNGGEAGKARVILEYFQKLAG